MKAKEFTLKYDLLVTLIEERYKELLDKHKLIRFYDEDEDEFEEKLNENDHSLVLIGFTSPIDGDNTYFYVSEVSEHGIYATSEYDSTLSVFKRYNEIDNITGCIELIELMELWSGENTE
jgi:hypothetical protein